jgi:hypothetical protein
VIVNSVPKARPNICAVFTTPLHLNMSNTVEAVYWFCYADAMVPPFGLAGSGPPAQTGLVCFSGMSIRRPPIQQADVIVECGWL